MAGGSGSGRGSGGGAVTQRGGVHTACAVVVDGAGCRWDVAWVGDPATGANGFVGPGWRALAHAWQVAPGDWVLIERSGGGGGGGGTDATRPVELSVTFLDAGGRPRALGGADLLPIVGAAALRVAVVRAGAEAPL